MRLIDADWVIEHIKPYELSDEDWTVTGSTAIRLIHYAVNNAPTITGYIDANKILDWLDENWPLVWNDRDDGELQEQTDFERFRAFIEELIKDVD